jgi:hypothetical protein
MAITHANIVRNAFADIIANIVPSLTASNLILKLLSGTPPANAAAALAGNAVVAQITGVNFGTPSLGVTSVTSSVADTNAVGGTATFFRLYQSGGADPANTMLQGNVGTDLLINNATISAGSTVSLTSGSYTASP